MGCAVITVFGDNHFGIAIVILACVTLMGGGAAHAGAMSDYLENKLTDHVFSGTAYTAPTTIYIALFTSACSDSATGTEVSGGSYARQAVTWAAASAGTRASCPAH